MVKRAVAAALILVFLPVSLPIRAITIEEFEDRVDFKITLREMSHAIREGRAQTIDLDKFYIISGTVGDINPKQSWFFTLAPVDLRRPRESVDVTDPVALVDAISRADDALSLFIQRSLSDSTLSQLRSYAEGANLTQGLVDALLNDINEMIKKGTIHASGVRSDVWMTPELEEILTSNPEGEERAYASRLILDAAYPFALEPVRIIVELVSGEWIGTEDVESYHALLVFTGPESFKLFKRRRPSDAGPLAIQTDGRIMAVVRLIEPMQLPPDKVVWLMEGYRARKIN